MITGAGDSTVKLWTDSTLEMQVKEKEEKLALIEDEQKLSAMMRDNDLVSASVLAFKLNKLRDFYHALDRLVSGRAPPPRPFIPGIPGQIKPVLERSQDPVESIILNTEHFEKSLATNQPHMAENKKSTAKNVEKVIALLVKEDKKKLFETIKKLNARQEFASMAQVLLRELLPRFSPGELMEEFKLAGGGLKAVLEATDMYSEKHYNRADRNLKRSFYVQYVLSQMTLLEDKKLEKEGRADDSKTATMTSKSERKRERKVKEKKEARAKKATTNLFTKGDATL